MSKKQLLKALRLQPVATREEATALAAGTAALIIERDAVVAEKNAAQESATLGFEVAIDTLTERIIRNEKSLVAWAVAHRSEEFANSKSTLLAGHKLAFREGTGKLAAVEGKSEAEALDSLINSEDETIAERFVTVKPSLDKNAILTAIRNDPKLAEFFNGLGLVMIKEETCKFEPDLDTAPASTSHAA